MKVIPANADRIEKKREHNKYILATHGPLSRFTVSYSNVILHSSLIKAAPSRPHSTELAAEVLELDYQGDFQATRSAPNPATILQSDLLGF